MRARRQHEADTAHKSREAVHAAKFSDLETSSAREIELRKAREAELSKQVAPY
jgi:hypothetical protein